MERRNRFQIIIDILEFIFRKRKVKVTHILYGSNLSYDRLKGYIKELTEKGLIQEIKEKDKTFYIITTKGINFISQAKKIQELTEAFGL